jgi:ankyrin repeat protein
MAANNQLQLDEQGEEQRREDQNREMFDAILAFDLERLRIAIKNGADVDDNQKFCPLNVVLASDGNEEDVIKMVKLLVDSGASTTRSDQNECGPIFYAIKNLSSIEILKHLIRPLKSLNIACCYGFTPLHLAVRYYNKEAAIFLLQNGADPEIEDEGGDKPFDIIREDDEEWMSIKKDFDFDFDLLIKEPAE